MKTEISKLSIVPEDKPGDKEESRPLILEAYKKIKQMLFQQKLVPGQRLVYNDLGKMLNMSRTPIINALNRLEQEGFVASENFRGFYVKPIDLDEIWDAFGLREALETYAVERAIKSCSPGDIQLLEEKRVAHEHSNPPYYTQDKFRLDMEFHMQIATMAKNQLIKFQLKRNFEHLYLRSRLNDYDIRRMEASASDHQRLLDRMKRKDIRGSIEILRSHIQSARDLVISCLSKEME